MYRLRLLRNKTVSSQGTDVIAESLQLMPVSFHFHSTSLTLNRVYMMIATEENLQMN
jgi:hypothetical protein